MHTSPLITALLGLANTIPSLPRTRSYRSTEPSAGRKKTKKGATHTIGAHFKPKFLIFLDGKPVTPAMYSRLHLGVQNPRKKNGHKSTN